MTGDDIFLWALIVGPGLIALAAFAGSIWLFSRSSSAGDSSWVYLVGATFLLLTTLGIGACYAVTCFGFGGASW